MKHAVSVRVTRDTRYWIETLCPPIATPLACTIEKNAPLRSLRNAIAAELKTPPICIILHSEGKRLRDDTREIPSRLDAIAGFGDCEIHDHDDTSKVIQILAEVKTAAARNTSCSQEMSVAAAHAVVTTLVTILCKQTKTSAEWEEVLADAWATLAFCLETTPMLEHAGLLKRIIVPNAQANKHTTRNLKTITPSNAQVIRYTTRPPPSHLANHPRTNNIHLSRNKIAANTNNRTTPTRPKPLQLNDTPASRKYHQIHWSCLPMVANAYDADKHVKADIETFFDVLRNSTMGCLTENHFAEMKKAGHTARDILETFRLWGNHWDPSYRGLLKTIGYTVADLKNSGFPATSLRLWNHAPDYSVKDVLRHYTAAQLHEGGYHTQMLKLAEMTMPFACYNTPEVLQCREQKRKGIAIATLSLVYPIRTLKLAGFAAREMQAAGFDANELRLKAGYTADEFYDHTMNAREVTMTTITLLRAGYAQEGAIKGMTAWMGPYGGQRWRQLVGENSKWLEERTHRSKTLRPWCTHCDTWADIEHLLTARCRHRAARSLAKKSEILEAIKELNRLSTTVEHSLAKKTTSRQAVDVGDGVITYINNYYFEEKPSNYNGIPEASNFIRRIKENCGMIKRVPPPHNRLRNLPLPKSSDY